MRVELTKHHGLGNDFLVLSDALPALDLPALDLPALARQWCDRRRGIGADGLLVMSAPAADAEIAHEVRMTLFNADGSIAEMSGNGIRCFAQAWVMRHGLHDGAGLLRILTDAGVRVVHVSPTGSDDTIEVSVDMGEVAATAAPDGWEGVGCNPDRPVMHLSLGNPHTVVGVDEVDTVDLLALGRQVPGTNLEIIEPGDGPHVIRMRVHERGAGITEACGTGACASAFAARAWGLVAAGEREIVVHMDGGRARVQLDEPTTGRVTLIGPSVYVGSITIDVSDQTQVQAVS